MSAGPPRNRLAGEHSPYLLQHAANPVDWYPWGDEAIAAARERDVPIFLSIGYSTCHWCHVMERESFEDEGVAAFMNEHFVNIKIDREEHPDVDQIYMSAVQGMTGHGGWPMSVWLTHDLEPYHAGTYFPPNNRWGQPGFLDVLAQTSSAWNKARDRVIDQANSIREWIDRRGGPSSGALPVDRRPIDKCLEFFAGSFDEHWGGFGAAPKFPRPMALMLILRDHLEAPTDRKTAMIDKTLEMMWRGGMYDHVGCGFARYSTDEQWLVPHFEKMLYDNALLARSYAESWRLGGNDDWRVVATEVLDWTLEEMTHPDGGFFSAQDADSEGVEGKFYVWDPTEIVEVLGEEDGGLFCRVYGVVTGGNFEGQSICWLAETLEANAEREGMARADLVVRLRGLRRRLYEHRDARIHPGLDDKVLTSWNGLMIGAMAYCGAAFGEARFIDAALRSAEFVERELTDGATVLRRWREGHSALAGTLEDYAFLAWGYLDLFDATGDPRWLTRAMALSSEAVTRFCDEEGGGFFFTEADTPHILARMKEPYDGATPSGNSVMAVVLARLGAITGEAQWRTRAEETVAAFAADLSTNPSAYPLLACALDALQAETVEVVVAVAAGDEANGDALLNRAREGFHPHRVTIRVDDSNRTGLAEVLPWLAEFHGADGKSAAHVCRNRTCGLPVTLVDELEL